MCQISGSDCGWSYQRFCACDGAGCHSDSGRQAEDRKSGCVIECEAWYGYCHHKMGRSGRNSSSRKREGRGTSDEIRGSFY